MGQALFDTANDVAAAAKLLGHAVLTDDPNVVQACRALGVTTALPPPRTTSVPTALGGRDEPETTTPNRARPLYGLRLHRPLRLRQRLLVGRRLPHAV